MPRRVRPGVVARDLAPGRPPVFPGHFREFERHQAPAQADPSLNTAQPLLIAGRGVPWFGLWLTTPGTVPKPTRRHWTRYRDGIVT